MAPPLQNARAAPSTYFNLRLMPIGFLRETFRTAGQWVAFIALTLWLLPVTVGRYRRQTLQIMNSLAWGRGSLIVDGGVISVLVILGVAIGAMVAVEGYAMLNLVGLGTLSGIIGGWANVREFAPLVTGVAFASQAGCRMTAEIGSMRVADEIDATEVMGLRSIPFVVGTRLIGGMLCVVPGFLLELMVAFFTSYAVIRVFYNQSGGTYEHYFVQFLSPTDIGYALIKAVVYCAAATLIHCYYGYFASGGPVGVGQASGRAIRASLITIMVLDITTTVMLWGWTPKFEFKG